MSYVIPTKINGKFVTTNPLQAFGMTSQSFQISQDFAPENYIVNQPINFEIDQTQIETMVSKNFLKDTTYIWDYGDGNHAEGLKQAHAYSKIGTYIMVLTVNVYVSREDPPTQIVDSYLINVIPDKDFNGLPQAVMKVDGQQFRDQSSKIVDINFENEIQFDASESKSTSRVVDYLWDFGDGTTASGSKVAHKFNNKYYVTVVLRIRDANRFFSDAFIGLKNNPQNTLAPELVVSKTNSPTSAIKIQYFFLPFVLLLLIGVVFYKFLKKKNAQ